MPPPKEKVRPTKDQIEKVRKWIEQGAEWPTGSNSRNDRDRSRGRRRPLALVVLRTLPSRHRPLPIAMLSIAALMEFLQIIRKKPASTPPPSR
jgi:hypothetical protein